MKIVYLAVALSLLLSPAARMRAAEDPPAKRADSAPAADSATQTKGLGAAVKHDAKVVADATKDGAHQVAAAAKHVAHEVAAASKQSAHEVAATAKRGAEKVKAAVHGDPAEKPAAKTDAAPSSAPPSH
jgi:hypothetical protein